jgi:predicted Zn-dependent protease
MIRRFRIFIGPARLRLLLILLAITGLGNIILNFFAGQLEWARPAQTILALIFLVGAAVIIGGRMDNYERGRWTGLLLPAFGAVLLGVLLLPDYLLLMMGLALGWIVAGLLLFRPRGPMQYQQAVKQLRRSQYADAVKTMDGLIRDEPDNPNHYRFRAEILRLWGKLDRARRDYEHMIRLEPDSAVAHNGLAEVLLQAGNYEAARQAALQAYQLAPGEWVAAYNLGMIEDRLAAAGDAIEHLNRALQARVPDARHRLLIHFYLARAYARRGDLDAAREAVAALRKQRSGLQEWQTILESDQAETLRKVIQADIDAAQALADGRLAVEALAQEDRE